MLGESRAKGTQYQRGAGISRDSPIWAGSGLMAREVRYEARARVSGETMGGTEEAVGGRVKSEARLGVSGVTRGRTRGK